LRQLSKDGGIEGNTLFFSNKTDEDIILAEELKAILGHNAHFTVTAQGDSKNDRRRIDKNFLKTEIKDFKKHFYVCGPDQMVADINKTLAELGAKADSVIFEK
jgi:ferredoxin-NADP reductase